MPMLLSLSKICVQSETDLKRYQSIGTPGSRLTLTGNLKFDQAIPPFTESKKMALMQSIGLSSNQDILVAGSTHEGEEKTLLSVLGELKLSRPNLRLVLAPRDPKRSAAVCRLAKSMGHVTLTLTSITASSEKPDYDVLVVDAMGALRELYAISDIAFVGGSLVPCSGHNPLEPAAYAKPVLFGPDMNDFLDISQTLMAQNGALEVNSENSLAKEITHLLSDPSNAITMGRCAYDTFRANAGAVEKTIMEISNLL
jgi:3-deoxy-D-manno-octulosonic-acid transferase